MSRHFLISVLLVVITSVLIIIPSDSTMRYLALNQEMLHRIILPDVADFDDRVPNRQRQHWLYNVDDFLDTISGVVDNYYDIPSKIPDRLPGTESISLSTPLLYLSVYTEGLDIYDVSKRHSLSTSSLKYSLTLENPIGPFINDSLTLIRTTADMRISLTFNVTHAFSYSSDPSSAPHYYVLWYIDLLFDFATRGGRVGVSMTTDYTRHGDPLKPFSLQLDSLFFWSYVIQFILAIVSLSMCVKSLTTNMISYRKNRQLLQSIQSQDVFDSIADLTGLQSLRFFDGWLFLFSVNSVICMISSVVQILQSLIVSFSSTSKILLFLMGMSCFTAWLCLLYYFKYIKDCGVFIMTLNRGLRLGFAYVTGGMPIFLGYALFGTAMFATVSEKFDTFGQSCVTLFALINGDEILEVFDDIYAGAPLISRIYIYSYICFFIYCMLNIFIQIMEGAFIAAKEYYYQKMIPITLITMRKQ
ncbi:hypothetical protein GEMRC1_002690 [Eukaryota sp. GEM-RC1]